MQFRDIPVSYETDGDGNHVAHDVIPQAPVKSSCISLLQTTTEDKKENADAGQAEKSSDMKLLEISDDCNEITHRFLAETVAEQEVFSEEKDQTDDFCYFCKNALFYCHHIISCVSTVKNNHSESARYESLDPSALNNFSEVNVIAFDLRQLLSRENSPASEDCDHNIHTSVTKEKLASNANCENVGEAKSQKDGRDVKLNFDLDFSVFEQCLFEEEMLHEDHIGNLKNELAVSEVDQKIVHSAVNVSADLLKIKSVCDSMISSEREIEPAQGSPSISPSIVAPDIFSKAHCIERTPPRDEPIEAYFNSANHFHKETSSNHCNLLLSPTSPIFGSVLKKHASEPPVFGSVVRNVCHKPARTLPVCSTPKIHKKNLFLGNVILGTTQEGEGDFTSNSAQHLEVKGEKSVNVIIDDDCEEYKLKSPVSEISNLPRPNFDLFDATQWLGNLESGVERVENVRNKASCTRTESSSMCTVTQLLSMVDNTVSVQKEKEEFILPCEPVERALLSGKRNQLVQGCSDTVYSNGVPDRFSESCVTECVPPKADKYTDSINCIHKINPNSTSNITLPGYPVLCSVARTVSHVPTDETSSLPCPTVQQMPVGDQKKLAQKYLDDNYLRDGNDDIFVDLAIDSHSSTTSKQSTSVTSVGVQGVCTINNTPEIGTDLLDKIGRAHLHKDDGCENNAVDFSSGKQVADPVFESEFTSLITTKISKFSAVDHNHLTTAVTKPSSSSLSLKRKLKDAAKVTCMEKSLVKTTGNVPNIRSSPDLKRRNFGQENSSRITGDGNQYAEVSATTSRTVLIDKQKEISGSIDFEDQMDWFVSLDKDRTALHNNSIATHISSKGENVSCKVPSGDNSPVIKPLVRKRKRKTNISSTSNESGILSPYSMNDNCDTIIRHERVEEHKSLPLQGTDLLTTRKSNLDMSEKEEDNSLVLISDVKKCKISFSDNKLVDHCVPGVKSNIIEISSEEDSDFKSQDLMRLKKRNQSRVADENDRNETQRKAMAVTKKPKVTYVLGCL